MIELMTSIPAKVFPGAKADSKLLFVRVRYEI